MCLHICSPLHSFPVTMAAGLTCICVHVCVRVRVHVSVCVCLCVYALPIAELHNSFHPGS